MLLLQLLRQLPARAPGFGIKPFPHPVRDLLKRIGTASVGRRSTRCPRAFLVAATGISPMFRVGSALRCHRASSSLVRDGSRDANLPGSRRCRGKSCLPRSAAPTARPESPSRATPRRCGCSSRCRLPHQDSRPGLAQVLRRWSTCRPRPTVATGFAVKCCKDFHQVALPLAWYLASAQLSRRMKCRS